MSKENGNVLLSSGILASIINTQIPSKKAKYVAFSDLATFVSIFDRKMIELGAYNHLIRKPFVFTSPIFEQEIFVKHEDLCQRCRTIFNKYVKRCGDIIYKVDTKFFQINSRTYSNKVFFESSPDTILRDAVLDARERQTKLWKNLNEESRREKTSSVYVYRKDNFSDAEKSEAMNLIADYISDYYTINGFNGIDPNKIKEAARFAVNVFARNDFDKFNSEYNIEVLKNRDLYEANEQDTLEFEA